MVSVGVNAYLYQAGQPVAGLVDPSGGRFDAAGDFDRLIPAVDASFTLLSQVDPYDDLELPQSSMSALAAEVDTILPSARQAPNAVAFSASVARSPR